MIPTQTLPRVGGVLAILSASRPRHGAVRARKMQLVSLNKVPFKILFTNVAETDLNQSRCDENLNRRYSLLRRCYAL
jgi:hypothetical protein